MPAHARPGCHAPTATAPAATTHVAPTRPILRAANPPSTMTKGAHGKKKRAVGAAFKAPACLVRVRLCPWSNGAVVCFLKRGARWAGFKALLASPRLSAQTAAKAKAAKKKKANARFDEEQEPPPATAAYSAEDIAAIMAMVAEKMEAREAKAKATAAQAAKLEDLMQELVAVQGIRQQQRQQPADKAAGKQALGKRNARGRAKRTMLALVEEGIDVRKLQMAAFETGLLCGIKRKATGAKATE